MILTSHQPNFLPYMGVFYKAFKSEVLVLSDDVCYSKKGMHNWNRIQTKAGEQKITVPVNAHHDSRLCDISISDPMRNLPKICRTIKEAYARANHFSEGMEIIDRIEALLREDLRLVELNSNLIYYILRRFGIKTEVIMASELGITGHKDDRILQMCKIAKADTYYSGTGAKAYHDEERYRKNGINLVYSDYQPVVYQRKYKPFLPNMSVIDYIFNAGFRIPEVWL